MTRTLLSVASSLSARLRLAIGSEDAFEAQKTLGRVRSARDWLRELRTPHHASVPSRWLRKAPVAPDSRVCIFVALGMSGRVSDHALHHARAWADQGYAVVFVVVVNDLAANLDLAGTDFAAGILLRENQGYDFGAWAGAIGQMPDLSRAGLLVTVNDSVLGPLAAFGEMLRRVERTDADVIGLTDNHEYIHHLQSYCLFFKQRALRSRAFRRFWSRVRTGERWLVIRRYELRMRRVMERAGLRTVALFPSSADQRRNPSAVDWQRLVDEGFPYVKVQSVRDNLERHSMERWVEILTQAGYDPDLAAAHLASVVRRS